MAAEGSGAIQQWSPGSRTLTGTLPAKSDVLSVAVSPDGKLLAANTRAGTTQLWDLASRTQRATLPAGNADAAETVAFSANGKYLATGNLPATRLLDVRPDSVVSSPVASLPAGQAESVWSLAFSGNGRSMAVGTTGGTQQWDVTSRTLTAKLPVGTGTRANALALSRGGSLALVRAQHPPCLPAHAAIVRPATGPDALSIQFAAPDPLGLLTACPLRAPGRFSAA